jgi:hypothetical protein
MEQGITTGACCKGRQGTRVDRQSAGQHCCMELTHHHRCSLQGQAGKAHVWTDSLVAVLLYRSHLSEGVERVVVGGRGGSRGCKGTGDAGKHGAR